MRACQVSYRAQVALCEPRDQLREVLEQRRAIFGHEPTVEQVNAFLAGFDLATGFALLRDFHEWLVVKLGGGYNIHWFGLLHNLAVGIGPYEVPPPDQDDPTLGTRMLELAVEFLDDVDGLDGRRTLYAQYEQIRAAEGLA